jgi:hypothetical protein
MDPYQWNFVFLSHLDVTLPIFWLTTPDSIIGGYFFNTDLAIKVQSK